MIEQAPTVKFQCGRKLAQVRWKRWCPGRESYATTDTTNRCLSLAWWRECWHSGGGWLHRHRRSFSLLEASLILEAEPAFSRLSRKRLLSGPLRKGVSPPDCDWLKDYFSYAKSA
jgi:hypothetical protein